MAPSEWYTAYLSSCKFPGLVFVGKSLRVLVSLELHFLPDVVLQFQI